MKRRRIAVALVAALVCTPVGARADVVLDCTISNEGRVIDVQVLSGHAQVASPDAAATQELIFDLHREIDGNGEGQPHEAGRGAVDGHVDPDHFSVHVEQWAA